MALDKPIISVNTLESMAIGVYTKRKKIPLIDARGGRVYYGIYEGLENVELEPPSLTTIDELLERLSKCDDSFVLVGDCATDYSEKIEKYSNLEITPAFLNSCISKNAISIGQKKYENNQLSDCYTLSPEYVRESQAQSDLKKKEKEF